MKSSMWMGAIGSLACCFAIGCGAAPGDQADDGVQQDESGLTGASANTAPNAATQNPAQPASANQAERGQQPAAQPQLGHGYQAAPAGEQGQPGYQSPIGAEGQQGPYEAQPGYEGQAGPYGQQGFGGQPGLVGGAFGGIPTCGATTITIPRPAVPVISPPEVRLREVPIVVPEVTIPPPRFACPGAMPMSACGLGALGAAPGMGPSGYGSQGPYGPQGPEQGPGGGSQQGAPNAQPQQAPATR
jgi:hypothetical protein